MFQWMVWTTPVAVFFICVALMLVGMTVWEVKSPTTLRKGFLPIATTRGDRLFIGLMVMAWINLAYVGLGEHFMDWFDLEDPPSLWISFAISLIALAGIMRKG